MPKSFKKRGGRFKSKKMIPTTRRVDIQQDKAITTLKKKVKKIEGDDELKHIDKNYAATDVGTGGIVLWETHNFTVQGTSNITRIGNVISPTSFLISVRFRIDNAQLLEDSRVRMIIFWDKQANGAAPDLDGVNGLVDDSVTTNLIYAPRNFNLINRYQVVIDKTWTLHPVMQTIVNVASGATTQVSRTSFTKKYYIKANKRIRYMGNAGTIADLASNAFYLAFYGELGANPPEVDGSVRMYFKDC